MAANSRVIAIAPPERFGHVALALAHHHDFFGGR
jgi:hypothetical protein